MSALVTTTFLFVVLDAASAVRTITVCATACRADEVEAHSRPNQTERVQPVNLAGDIHVGWLGAERVDGLGGRAGYIAHLPG